MSKKRKSKKRKGGTKVAKTKRGCRQFVIGGESDIPIFVGVCTGALIKGEGVLQDFYDVGEVLLMPYFPQSLRGILLLVVLSTEMIKGSTRFCVSIKDKNQPCRTGRTDLTVELKHGATSWVRASGIARPYAVGEREGREGDEARGHPLLICPEVGYKLMSMPCPPLFVDRPTTIEVLAELGDREIRIGAFHCRFCKPAPLSEEERLAIMSRPGALKGIVCGLGCKKCGDKSAYHVSLDGSRTAPDEVKGAIYLPSAPDEWKCKCGKSSVPLTYLKEGFHDVFRRASRMDGREELKFIPLYQRGGIGAIMGRYQQMLNRCEDQGEEDFQKFIEENPIIWNFLAPLKIWKKPSISTKYNADFAILTRMKVLYFVEIEKPQTKLVKQDGGLHSELQRGLDQIREWRIEVGKRREAILDGLGLEQKDVHDIRYMLVAGMAGKTGARGLETVRAMKTDADFVFCFDEVTSFLHSTETALLNI
ncbi:MAG: DUF4263 domain-containing protein [Planctomycetota bacterium]|nr:MAG: DUF4263 domain-containing protein [Planctomycetota bacterium]